MISKNNKKFCVYEHLFPNGKRYIGITSKKPNARWENGSGYDNNKQYVMANAIKKYGWENIQHNILYTNLTEEEAKEKEIELIKKFNTYIHSENSMGYNMTLGGEGRLGAIPSEETRKKMSKAKKGKNGKDCPNSKPIICDGIEYESLTKFREATNIRGNVNQWLNGIKGMPKYWYDKGLHYKNDDFSKIICNENKRVFHAKIDDKTFYSQAELARYINVHTSTICHWFNKESKVPIDLYKRNLKLFIDGEEIDYEIDDREVVIGWEYKGKTFNNLRELADYLNIKKSKLWDFITYPNKPSAKKYLPLKDIHKIIK